MSSANREKRQRNRETKMSAAEEALRRSKRQRIVLVGVGLGLAIIVGAALVARAAGDDGKAASSSTTSSTGSTSSTASTTSTTIGSAAGKACVAVSQPLPAGTPAVPVQVGPPPKTLVKEDLKIGTGAVVKPHATITVNYVGVACSTGKVFDSSFGGEPLTNPLDGFVPGWRKGIPGMRVGGRRLLGLPAGLAYGATSPGPGIAPNESLWFVVEVTNTK